MPPPLVNFLAQLGLRGVENVEESLLGIPGVLLAGGLPDTRRSHHEFHSEWRRD
ncbi:hypothetical protein D3C87_1703550 [compost metagenome]